MSPAALGLLVEALVWGTSEAVYELSRGDNADAAEPYDEFIDEACRYNSEWTSADTAKRQCDRISWWPGLPEHPGGKHPDSDQKKPVQSTHLHIEYFRHYYLEEESEPLVVVVTT